MCQTITPKSSVRDITERMQGLNTHPDLIRAVHDCAVDPCCQELFAILDGMDVVESKIHNWLDSYSDNAPRKTWRNLQTLLNENFEPHDDLAAALWTIKNAAESIKGYLRPAPERAIRAALSARFPGQKVA